MGKGRGRKKREGRRDGDRKKGEGIRKKMELEDREKRKNIIIKEVEVKEERREEAVEEIIKMIGAKVEV